jgi:sialidase-1
MRSLLLTLLTSSAAAALAAEPVKTDVFVAGQNGYHTYRIPSLLADGKGGLLAFCEARSTKSDTGEIDLVLRRSQDQGKTWGDLQVVWEDTGHTCGNPCPVVDAATGTLWMLMTWNHGKVAETKMQAGYGTDSRRVFVTHSKDAGATWAIPKEITASAKKPEWSWYATGPGAGIQIKHGAHAGRMVIPCDHKTPRPAGLWLGSHVVYSDDHGATWKLGGEAPQDKVNECEVVELSDGQLMLNMRNYAKESPCRQTCISKDGGITWQDQKHDPALLDPVCQASVHRCTWPKDNQPGVILFSNPASTRKRENLTLRASTDDCQSWPTSRLLHAGPAAYSSLAIVKDTTIGCLYEADDYQRIIFAAVELEWVTK